MSKYPVCKPKELVRILQKIGFTFHRQKGSHQIFVKDEKMVVVPRHNKDLKLPTQNNIIKGAFTLYLYWMFLGMVSSGKEETVDGESSSVRSVLPETDEDSPNSGLNSEKTTTEEGVLKGETFFSGDSCWDGF